MSYFFDGDREHDPLGTSRDFNRRILIMAIVSLSVVMVIVLALHLYARFYLTSRRRAAIYQLSLSHANANANSESHNTGLDPNLINSLPTFPFKQQQQQQQQPDEDPVECAVCLSVLQHGEYVKLLPNCKHSFHLGCIDTWLASHSTCPICRSKAQPVRLEPQPREGPTGSVLDVVVAVAVAPIVENVVGTSNAANDDNNNHNGSPKISGSNPRFSSFRRILSRDSSSTRIQPSANVDVEQDFQRL